MGREAHLSSWRCLGVGGSPVRLEMPLLDPQPPGPAGCLAHFYEGAFCALAIGSGWVAEGQCGPCPWLDE